MLQEKININENKDAQTLSKKLSDIGANLILSSISKIAKGEAVFVEQNHKEATYAKKILKTEGQIRWEDNAKEILAKINGLNPNPGAWFKYKNERYKVWKAKIVENKNAIGVVLDDSLTIGCKDQSIRILEIQKEGKSRQTVEKFLLGNKIEPGEKLFNDCLSNLR